MTDVAYKRGDTISLEARLPVDLSQASSVSLGLYDDEEVLSDSAVIDDASNGIVAYDWDDGETDRRGLYELDWTVTWSDGGVESFPKDGRDTIYFYG